MEKNRLFSEVLKESSDIEKETYSFFQFCKLIDIKTEKEEEFLEFILNRAYSHGCTYNSDQWIDLYVKFIKKNIRDSGHE